MVAKQPGDRGGGPIRSGGRTVLLEDVRLPAEFKRASVPYFSTNTFWADAAAVADQTEKILSGSIASQYQVFGNMPKVVGIRVWTPQSARRIEDDF